MAPPLALDHPTPTFPPTLSQRPPHPQRRAIRPTADLSHSDVNHQQPTPSQRRWTTSTAPPEQTWPPETLASGTGIPAAIVAVHKTRIQFRNFWSTRPTAPRPSLLQGSISRPASDGGSSSGSAPFEDYQGERIGIPLHLPSARRLQKGNESHPAEHWYNQVSRGPRP